VLYKQCVYDGVFSAVGVVVFSATNVSLIIFCQIRHCMSLYGVTLISKCDESNSLNWPHFIFVVNSPVMCFI
jgi:hypothetical protein